MDETTQRPFKWFPVMILVSVFQLITSCSVIFKDGETDIKLLGVFAALVLLSFCFDVAIRTIKFAFFMKKCYNKYRLFVKEKLAI